MDTWRWIIAQPWGIFHWSKYWMLCNVTNKLNLHSNSVGNIWFSVIIKSQRCSACIMLKISSAFFLFSTSEKAIGSSEHWVSTNTHVLNLFIFAEDPSFNCRSRKLLFEETTQFPTLEHHAYLWIMEYKRDTYNLTRYEREAGWLVHIAGSCGFLFYLN